MNLSNADKLARLRAGSLCRNESRRFQYDDDTFLVVNPSVPADEAHKKIEGCALENAKNAGNPLSHFPHEMQHKGLYVLCNVCNTYLLRLMP